MDYGKLFAEFILTRYSLKMLEINLSIISISRKMVKYKVPNDVISRFCEKAGKNKKNGNFIETLAFLVGFKENDVITVTDIVFGKQEASSISVDDHGKH